MNSFTTRGLKRALYRRVLGGIFQGLLYIGESRNSSFFPKILGTYEAEISSDVRSFIVDSQSTVVDIGCAEGYYANGTLLLNPKVMVVAYDVDPLAQLACQEIAILNGHKDRILVRDFCDRATLKDTLNQFQVDLLIVDVEGYEYELLDPVEIPELKTVRIVVELHEHLRTGTSIQEKFAQSHEVRYVAARQPSWRDIDNRFYRYIAMMNRTFEHKLVYERPDGMSWLIMQPKEPFPCVPE